MAPPGSPAFPSLPQHSGKAAHAHACCTALCWEGELGGLQLPQWWDTVELGSLGDSWEVDAAGSGLWYPQGMKAVEKKAL